MKSKPSHAEIELVGGADDGARYKIPGDCLDKPFLVITPLTALAEAVAGERRTVRTLRYTYRRSGEMEDGTIAFQLSETEVGGDPQA